MEISNLSDAEFKNTGYKEALGTQWVFQQYKKDPGRNEGYIN